MGMSKDSKKVDSPRETLESTSTEGTLTEREEES